MYFLFIFKVLQRERWMSKAPEPQAIQKLLHSRKTKNNSSNASVLTASSNNSASSNASEGGGAKSIATADAKKSGKNAEKVLSKYWDERARKERPRKELITGVLPNKYQPEPVVKKIAFGGLFAFCFDLNRKFLNILHFNLL